MAEAVNDREIKNRAVFSQPTIGKNRAEERHPVNRRNKLVKPTLRFVLRHAYQNSRTIEHELRHESDEDRTHSIEAETLRTFVADDVRNARRHACEIRRRCQILVISHTYLLP